MNSKSNALLWWIGTISLVVSIAAFIFLKNQASVDVRAQANRMLLPVVGILIAGVCLIAGTAGRWFQSK